MAYTKGQVVCLWKEEISEGKVTVTKEILVTITDIKTGVPGEWSGKPTNQQSLRGLGDDGKIYEKHWEYWPESQTSDFAGQWSMRQDDGEVWIPQEATYLHNRLNDHNRKYPDQPMKRVDLNGQLMLPKGDLTRCDKHDEYQLPGSKCFQCFLEEHKAKNLALQKA